MRKKATKIHLFNFSSAAMRAFHMSWLAFFVCFFAWFACAPLMPVIAGEFHLTKDQIANINIAAVAITIVVRLIVGPLCDKYGPRKTYTALLIIGSIPVFGVASANSYESFLFFRLLDWRNWCQLCYHPISHQYYVCTKCRRHCKCNHSRLG